MVGTATIVLFVCGRYTAWLLAKPCHAVPYETMSSSSPRHLRFRGMHAACSMHACMRRLHFRDGLRRSIFMVSAGEVAAVVAAVSCSTVALLNSCDSCGISPSTCSKLLQLQ